MNAWNSSEARMEEGIREALKKHGRNYTFHRAGSDVLPLLHGRGSL